MCLKKNIMAHAPISNTDVLLWTHLANKEKVAVPDKIENLINVPDPHEFEHDDVDSSDPEMDRFNQKQIIGGGGGGGMFDSIVENELSRMNQPESVGNFPHGSSPRNTHFSHGSSPRNTRFSHGSSPRNTNFPHDSPRNPRSMPMPREYDAPSPQYQFRNDRFADEEDQIRQKAARQFLMSELHRKQQQGVPLSMTMDEFRTQPLHVLKTEHDITNESQGSAHNVTMMRGGIKVFMKLCEAGNRKAGNFLPLDEWADTTFERDPHIFDHSLERIHNLYFRNSYSHPLWELGQTMLVSAGSHCVENFMNPSRSRAPGPTGNQFAASDPANAYSTPVPPPGAAPQASQRFAPPPPPPQQNHAFAPPPAQTVPPPPTQRGDSGAPPVGNGRGRRTLRPPFTSQTRSEPVSTIPIN